MSFLLPYVTRQLLDIIIREAELRPEALRPFYAQFILTTTDKVGKSHPDSDGDSALTLAETILFASAFAAIEHIPLDSWPTYIQEVKRLVGELFPEIHTSTPGSTTLN